MGYLIEEHADHLRSAGCSQETIYRRCNLLRRLNEHLPLGLAYASTAQLKTFLASLHRNRRSQATLVNYDMHIRGFYSWADAEGILDGDPTLRMKRPRKPGFHPKPATREEIELALTSPEPWLTMCALAYFAGMRAFEIAACRREDITETTTFIPKAKGGDRADVPTHPFVWWLVSNLPSGRLFPSGPRGGPVDGHWISQNSRLHFQRLGMPKLTIHRLRHSYGTDLVLAGVDAWTVQKLMRHANMNTTQAYIEVTNERKRAAVALLSVPGVRTPASL